MEIKRVNLKEQIYNLIKDRILERKYKLGEQLVISQISEEIGVSNTPIREALSFLESEGLVNFIDGKYKVIELKGSDLKDLNIAILSQLLAALNLIIQNNKVENLIKLEEESLEKQNCLRVSDAIIDFNYVKTFVDFNRNIVLACENKYLLKVFDNLFSVLVLATSYNKKIYRDIHYFQHVEIYDALINEDYDLVRKALAVLFDKDEDAMDI